MLAIVLSLVEFSSLIQTLKSIPVWTAFVVVLGYLMGQALSAIKWNVLANSGGVSASAATALKAYFIGMYVNCFGLGILGGDFTRAMLLAGGRPLKTESLTSVVADRAHGLAVLSLLGLCSTLLFGYQTLDPQYLYLLIFIGVSITGGWLLGPQILLFLVPATNKLRAKVETLVKFFSTHPKTLLQISVLSLLFHVLQIVLHGIIAYGLGASIPWQYLLIVIPFVNIASSLPISWNGLGVRETAYVFFFCGEAHNYMTEEQAVAMGAIWLLAVTVTSVFGGVVAFMTNDFKVLREKEAVAH